MDKDISPFRIDPTQGPLDIQVQPESLTMVLPVKLVDEEASTKEIVREDVQHMNNCLRAIYQGFSKAELNVTQVCKLVQSTMQVVTTRRSLMLKPSSYLDLKSTEGKDKSFGYDIIE